MSEISAMVKSWRRKLGLEWDDEVEHDQAIVPNGVNVQSSAEAVENGPMGASEPLPVEMTASEPPRPNDWQEGPTPVLGGLMSRIDDHGSSSVFSAVPAVWGYGLTPGATVRDYAHSLTDPYEIMQRYVDDWPDYAYAVAV